MAGEADIGLLCRKHEGDRLCFKSGGSRLVYKIETGGETTVTFAWPGDVKDLDILAYWDGAPNLTAGYNNGSGGTDGVYSIEYSGDVQSAGASEWCKIRMSKWSNRQRTFRVHFNAFGYDSEDYPGSSCMVIAVQENGQTYIKHNQACSTRSRSAANSGDPFCVVSFDERGMITGVS